MMGKQPQVQKKMFYTTFNLDNRVRKDHILRKIATHIDFDFTYNEVKDKYGSKGNVSVPPPIILKMMMLLIFYNVRSERELMDTIPERLDWLWFLGYDIDDEIPDHSVLSKARARWGIETFKTFFDRIVRQCVEAGLVDGSKLFMDSSLIQADASNNSVVDTESLDRYLNKSYQELESRLEKEKDDFSDDDETPKNGTANKRYISTTDPDASVTRRGKGNSTLQFHIHRGVDDKNEVITATDVTPGSVNEAHMLGFLIDEHKRTTGRSADTVVADSKYGTIDNFLECYDRRIKGHMPSLEKTGKGTGKQKGIFPKEAFAYDPDTDTFICPAGQILKKRKLIKKRNHYEYIASKRACNNCGMKAKCTKAKTGRTLKRHLRQNELDAMYELTNTSHYKRDIRTRKHLIERTFARATRYGFKRARWRRLWRVQIHEYLTSTIQNIMILVRNINKPEAALGVSRRNKNDKKIYSDKLAEFFQWKRKLIQNILKNSDIRLFNFN